MTYYTYRHRAGYGRDDHMADEIIARAARQLGLETGTYIAQAAGFASHPAPLGRAEVRVAHGPGVRTNMERALRAAREEVSRRDCSIYVVCCRVRVERTRWETITYHEEKRGRNWQVIDMHVVERDNRAYFESLFD